MKIYAKKRNSAFTLIELLVVIAIIALLAGLSTGAVSKGMASAKRIKSVNNVRSVGMGLQIFAKDNDGLFPSYDPDDDQPTGDDSSFSNSTEAFDILVPDYVPTEELFWLQTKDPDKQRPPNDDGELLPEENCLFYVVGQTDTSYANSPLVGEGMMDGPGIYGEYHPWLDVRQAVIGYVDGHVAQEKLTSNQAGATARSRDGSVKDIFEEREINDDGKASGGRLDTSKDNVLLPD